MKPISINKTQLSTAKRLLLAATVCLLFIYGLFLFTRQAAIDSERQHLIKSLSQVLPNHTHPSNDLLSSRTRLGDSTVYQACINGKPRYQIYEIETQKGYSGLIKLLVSIDKKHHRIVRIRPLFHQETPGLGDQIEVEKSPWIKQFELSLKTPPHHIALTKDKGHIDAITGATITSRAVTNVIRHTFFDNPPPSLPNLCRPKHEKH